MFFIAIVFMNVSSTIATEKHTMKARMKSRCVNSTCKTHAISRLLRICFLFYEILNLLVKNIQFKAKGQDVKLDLLRPL